MSEETLIENETEVSGETEVTVSEETATEKKKTKYSLWVAIPIIVLIVVVVGGLTVVVLRKTGIINPYEKNYIDITGRTAGEIAQEKHYKYEKFLKDYGLPEDMPKNTSENAMYNHMPVRVFVEKTPGIESFEQLKADMGWDDSITEDTTVGEAIDKTKLKYYIGEDQLERFKLEYNLPDVTGDTLYGDIRNKVETHQKQVREASGE